MTLLNGKGRGSNVNVWFVTNGQTAIQSRDLWAIQGDNAIFTQRGRAVGRSSLLGVLQEGTAIGGQFQHVTDLDGPMAEGQTLQVNLAQEVTRSNGAGAAMGAHGFIVDRLQALGSASASMSADQFINVAQDTGIHGGPCSDGSVTSGAYVTTTQTQAIE